jgi:hypothetical protein
LSEIFLHSGAVEGYGWLIRRVVSTGDRRHKNIYSLYIQGESGQEKYTFFLKCLTLKVKAVGSFETPATTRTRTQSPLPEDTVADQTKKKKLLASFAGGS